MVKNSFSFKCTKGFNRLTEKSSCVLLQTWGAIFCYQTTLGTIFARIFEDFAWIFDISKVWACACTSCIPTSNTTARNLWTKTRWCLVRFHLTVVIHTNLTISRKFSRNLGISVESISKASRHVLSTSEKHKIWFLVKRFVNSVGYLPVVSAFTPVSLIL